MFRLSNNLVGNLNFIIFLLSIPIIGFGIWLSTRGSTVCEKFLDMPIIIIGLFLMVFSLAGFIGACCRVSWLLWIYLLITFLLIVVLLCFTIFAFVVTHKGVGEVVSGKGFNEYKLGDYTNWLQKRISNSKNWKTIESCIRRAKVCEKLLERDGSFLDKFDQGRLSPLESGCCKPPTSCNYIFINATYWEKKTPASNDPDCTTWSNDRSKLCYSCESCKAGVIANIKKDWKKVAIVNIVFLIVLIIVYTVGCCAFRNNRRDNYYAKRWGRRP